MEANDQTTETVQGREDFFEHVQCPVCQSFFGMLIQAPSEPAMSMNIVFVRPDDVAEFKAALHDEWKRRGTMVREDGKLYEGGPTQAGHAPVNPGTTN